MMFRLTMKRFSRRNSLWGLALQLRLRAALPSYLRMRG
jgi:hypothetical protein